MPIEFKKDAYSIEYRKHRKVFNDVTTVYGEPISTVMLALQGLMGKTGFNRKFGAALEGLRYKMRGAEAEVILASVGAMEQVNRSNARFGIKVANLTKEQIKQAAVIKMLRHLYMAHIQGGSEIWIATSPQSYSKQISRQLRSAGKAIYRQHPILEDVTEHFNAAQRKQITESTNEARRQVGATLAMLSNGRGNSNLRIHKIVRRWFSGSYARNTEVDNHITKLVDGLKKVENLINSNKIIYTDMPNIRHTTNPEDQKWSNVIAFVYASMAERIPIIYIEEGFFSTRSTTLSPKQSWANTVIHEITHLVLSTKDHRYRFQGLSPDHHLSSYNALENADSWSIFCADACNTLTQYQKLYFSYGRSLKPPAAPPVPPKIRRPGPPVPPPKIPRTDI